MLTHREMEIFDCSFVQLCSNDCVPLQHSASSCIEEMDYKRYPNGYNIHTIIGYFHMVIVDHIVLLT